MKSHFSPRSHPRLEWYHRHGNVLYRLLLLRFASLLASVSSCPAEPAPSRSRELNPGSQFMAPRFGMFTFRPRCSVSVIIPSSDRFTCTRSGFSNNGASSTLLWIIWIRS